MVSPASLEAEWVVSEALAEWVAAWVDLVTMVAWAAMAAWALTYMAVAWVVSVTSMAVVALAAVATYMAVGAVCMVVAVACMAVLLVALATWALAWAVSMAVNNNKWAIRLDNQCLVTTEEDRATKACLLFKRNMDNETIESNFDISLMAEGFHEAIIGKAMIANEPVVAYDYDICVEILHSSGMSYAESKMILEMVSRRADPSTGAPIFIKRAMLSPDFCYGNDNLH